jgi:hypothetical protein
LARDKITTRITKLVVALEAMPPQWSGRARDLAHARFESRVQRLSVPQNEPSFSPSAAIVNSPTPNASRHVRSRVLVHACRRV